MNHAPTPELEAKVWHFCEISDSSTLSLFRDYLRSHSVNDFNLWLHHANAAERAAYMEICNCFPENRTDEHGRKTI